MRAVSKATLQGRVRLPAPSPLPRAAAAERASSAVHTAGPPALPRVEALAEVLELGDKCRVAAAALDCLARHVLDHEPAALKRRAHSVIRVLLTEVTGRMVL